VSAEVKKEIGLEIGHVLFIDIVGYSKLLINEQSEQMQKLREIVRGTEQFRIAEAAGKLLRLPTGDGGALVFRTSPDAPVLCALEISKELKSHPELRVRMGIHSGPVNEITDLNEQANIAGAGINVAQRVMNCGDAGHILLSKHVAEDLEQYRQWQPHLHDLGECEVKHGVQMSAINFYTDEMGNPEVPEKFKAARAAAAKAPAKSAIPKWAAILIVIAIAIGSFLFWQRSKTSATTSAIPDKTIAVLPFENLSSDKENAYFTDGVQDEILTDLSKIADLKVISRTSVMQYKSGFARNLRKIGEELGVAHVVEGSVQRAANRIRVNAQLIDARNDAHLWAQTYDRDLADVFAIQSEIAKAIADQLQARLSPAEKKAIEQPPTTDVTAFDLYSRARNLLGTTSFSAINQPKLLQAIDLLNQALARDPSFLLAQCQLVYADANVYFLGIDHTDARRAQADAAVEAAFRIKPDAGEAHLARADNLYRVHRDYDGALAELDIARRTLPNDPQVFELTGYIARRRGQQEEGLRNLQRALELDPRNYFTLQQIALSYWSLRRYFEEIAVLDRALSIKPDEVDTRVTRAVVSLDWKADTAPLHQTIEEIRAKGASEAIKSVADNWFLCALAKRDAASAHAALAALGENFFGNDAVHLFPSFGEGLIARMEKDDAKAHAAFTAARSDQEKRLQTQPDYAPAICVLGLIDAGLGNKEAALREGRRAMELLPYSADSINGAHMIEYFAIIAAWVGEKDLALEYVNKAEQLPGYGTITYGQLKLTPYWDPLRSDPRFEKIVASLAPKQ
jgi:TolB-like protein/class 3 adenylate cyclase/Tfp pilus assembly protein PilF